MYNLQVFKISFMSYGLFVSITTAYTCMLLFSENFRMCLISIYNVFLSDLETVCK